MNHIIPVATSYQSSLLKNVERMTAAFPAEKAVALFILLVNNKK